MPSYYCRDCAVAWPYTAAFRTCPGCGGKSVTNMVIQPSIDLDDAEYVANHLIFDRKYNEREVERFRAEMDNTLGPSKPI